MLQWIFAIIFLFVGSGVAFSSQDGQQEPQAKRVLKAMWGQPAEDLTILPYMHDWHLLRTSKRDNNNPNPMLCLTYKGFFAGTIVNSFSIRTYAAGVQRYWWQDQLTPNLNLQLGYRLGLMYGYQHTHLFAGPDPLGWLCQHSPLFPAAQVIFDVTYRHVGIELSWMNVVVTGGAYIRF